MKIGIYSPYLNTMGGGERYMLSIASCLQNDNEVFLFWNDINIKNDAEKGLGIHLGKVTVEPDIFTNNNLIKKTFRTRLLDVVFMLSDGSIPLSFAKKNILHFQQPFRNVGGRNFSTQLKLKNIYKVLCNSKFTKKFIDLEFGVSSDVLYPPVNTSVFTGSPKAKKNIIISVGRFHPVKKHAILISAFQKLKNKENWKLLIAGGLLEQDNIYFNGLKNLVKGEDIDLFPNLPFIKLTELYKSSSIYWHATGFGENENIHPERMEHFGISPVEAMAAGCIPLVYRGGGLPEVVCNLGESYLWSNESELIERTEQFLINNTNVHNNRNELLSQSKLFDEQNFYKRIKQIIAT